MHGLGLIGLPEDSPQACKYILKSLRLRQETGERFEERSSVIRVAGLALQECSPHFGAQLLGAIESIHKSLNAVVEAELKHFHAQTLTEALDQLGRVGVPVCMGGGMQVEFGGCG